MSTARAVLLASLITVVLCFAVTAIGSTLLSPAVKMQLPRDSVYYEITNDGKDYGNYIETYHVPVTPGGKTVFCVVYSDKIGDGGGAGPSCDWVGFHKP